VRRKITPLQNDSIKFDHQLSKTIFYIKVQSYNGPARRPIHVKLPGSHDDITETQLITMIQRVSGKQDISPL
jgi:hypothetical protein